MTDADGQKRDAAPAAGERFAPPARKARRVPRMTDADGQKRDAAHAAVERFVHSGATVGLGSGTTSAFVVRRIGELLDAGELDGVRGIPTSEGTAALAREVGIPTVSLAEARPALTLDGADEIGPGLAAVKGLGGALLRKKIVAAAPPPGPVL